MEQTSSGVGRYAVQNAIPVVTSRFGDSVAAAVTTVEAEINRAGNREAAEQFTTFCEHVSHPRPNPVVLRSLWQGTIDAMPELRRLGDAVTQIKRIFAT